MASILIPLKNGIKLNVVPRLRNRKMMPWVLVEFIWRRKHCGDITGGILRVLKEVAYQWNSNNAAYLTEVI
ncbi:hypothetical protein A0J61_10656 [Choanephora cucurbitarum]|uniref:Uncharacterized protein n=1 Tax=Choanephora cucurbitarum TaxID=101091 RepID=A0A1C7MWP1_9FUNG|nr:hypothetical protein A0J61_10656 [Choanephora cucurbitarum]